MAQAMQQTYSFTDYSLHHFNTTHQTRVNIETSHLTLINGIKLEVISFSGSVPNTPLTSMFHTSIATQLFFFLSQKG